MLKSLLARPAPPEPPSPPDAPRPDRRLYVVGDIHGRIDLLDRMLEAIEGDYEANPAPGAQTVFLGDYVDYGKDGPAVLARIRKLTQEAPEDVVALKGNHEKMLLDFFDRAETHAAFWFRQGGLPTLRAFGIEGLTPMSSVEDIQVAAARLRPRVNDELIDWVRALPTRYASGNVHMVNGGMDPALPPEAQREQVLLWGHRDFTSRARGDRQWVVHGDGAHDAPQFGGNRIGIDTGAHSSGMLTCVVLDPVMAPRFLQSEP